MATGDDSPVNALQLQGHRSYVHRVITPHNIYQWTLFIYPLLVGSTVPQGSTCETFYLVPISRFLTIGRLSGFFLLLLFAQTRNSSVHILYF